MGKGSHQKRRRRKGKSKERKIEMMDIKITQTAHRKLFTYAKFAPDEIGGLGLVKSDGKEFTIYDVLLVDQDAGATHTELDESAVAKLMCDMMAQKKDVSELKLWWHSHAGFSTFWSGQDHSTVDKLGITAPWYLAVVVNKAGEYRARFDIFKPFRFTSDGLKLVEVPDLEIVDPLELQLMAEVGGKLRGGRAVVHERREYTTKDGPLETWERQGGPEPEDAKPTDAKADDGQEALFNGDGTPLTTMYERERQRRQAKQLQEDAERSFPRKGDEREIEKGGDPVAQNRDSSGNWQWIRKRLGY
jgi:proteasome lid subunit RPN8/RPN11